MASYLKVCLCLGTRGNRQSQVDGAAAAILPLCGVLGTVYINVIRLDDTVLYMVHFMLLENRVPLNRHSSKLQLAKAKGSYDTWISFLHKELLGF